MTFGIIGDVHAEEDRLEKALAFLSPRVDRILFVGDLPDGTGDLERCVAMLRDAGAIGVRGNHERWFLDNWMRTLNYPRVHRRAETHPDVVAYLEALPKTRTIETPHGAMLLCHGMGDDDMAQLEPDDEGYGLEVNDAVHDIVRAKTHRIVVAGHTHRRMCRVIGGVTFINAGTLAHDEPCVSILDPVAITFYAVPDFAILDRAMIVP